MVAAKCTQCKYSIVNTHNRLCPFYVSRGGTCRNNEHFEPCVSVEETIVPITPSRFYTPPCDDGMKVVQPNILTTEE